MKITTVPKPIPNEGLVEIQKNSLMRKIRCIENSTEKVDDNKVPLLKLTIKEIEIKHEEQVRFEKNELHKLQLKNVDYEKLTEISDSLKSKKSEKYLETKKDNYDILGKKIDKNI